MEPRRRVTASLASAFTLIAVIAAWIAFAPPQLGGQTSYVIVSGGSMEPGMHRGDLAIVRGQATYGVGDVVTYRHPQIGPVIHRIVAIDGPRYVLQGDNNDYLDPHQPVQAEMVGELWIHVPKVGAWLTRFRSPVYAAGLLFVAFVGLGGGAAAARTARKRRRPGERHAGAARAETRGVPTMTGLLRNWQDTLSLLVASAFGLGLLGWVAFTRPESHEIPDNTAYTQKGSFGYSAASAEGRVYDTGSATSGEPVYRRLSEAVAFTFEYEFESAKAATVGGTYQLVAELGDASGWRRTIPLTPETTFSGTTFIAEGVLSLTEAQSLIEVLEAQSGVENDRYTVTVTPRVTVAGEASGTPFEDTFAAASLPMELDAVQLRVAQHTGKEPEALLSPESAGNVTTKVSRSNTISLLAFGLPVAAARVISLAGLGLTLVAAGLFMWAVVRAQRAGTLTPEGTKLKAAVVTVRGDVPAARSRVVDVSSLDDLARISELNGSVVLQEVRPGFHAYFVYDGDLVYRYQAVGTPAFPAARNREQGAA